MDTQAMGWPPEGLLHSHATRTSSTHATAEPTHHRVRVANGKRVRAAGSVYTKFWNTQNDLQSQEAGQCCRNGCGEMAMGARTVHLLHYSDGVRRARLCHMHKTVHFKYTHFTIPNGTESSQITTNKNPVCTSPRSLSSAEVTSRW